MKVHIVVGPERGQVVIYKDFLRMRHYGEPNPRMLLQELLGKGAVTEEFKFGNDPYWNTPWDNYPGAGIGVSPALSTVTETIEERAPLTPTPERYPSEVAVENLIRELENIAANLGHIRQRIAKLPAHHDTPSNLPTRLDTAMERVQGYANNAHGAGIGQAIHEWREVLRVTRKRHQVAQEDSANAGK